jgi:ketosteroid isomerase-like protein
VPDGFDQITDDHVRGSEESYGLFRDGDLRFFDGLHPDVEWWMPETIPNGGVHRGEAGVVDFLESMGELFEEAYPDPEEFIPAGDRLIVVGTWRARVKATGEQVEARFAQIHGYRDGKLASFKNYIDSAKIVQALEARPGT